MEAATFDEVLALEETFYNDGYQQGKADGVKAGRIEGRTFGLEKGFEKFVESGRLYGKSLVWANRMPQLQESGGADLETTPTPTPTASSQKLPLLPGNQRLVKHLKVFHALAESDSLSTENSEEAVSDFDDRFKRAQAKAKVIERLVGETKGDLDSSGKIINGNANIEDASIRHSI
ncbi:putative ORAOV1 family protein [Lachnellula occidentalis]|uniref:Putative ORAOV1 family protein n=1 Tax=Lachnellula occidentalis TaxID=215460 RepID=A0A8H8RGK6_9HELO|nr:putative ORAOV1 family protein [Lachnellula occidentalis]